MKGVCKRNGVVVAEENIKKNKEKSSGFEDGSAFLKGKMTELSKQAVVFLIEANLGQKSRSNFSWANFTPSVDAPLHRFIFFCNDEDLAKAMRIHTWPAGCCFSTKPIPDEILKSQVASINAAIGM